MPLGLLLQRVVQSLERSTRRLEPWRAVVELEEVLLARARSAFLVRWWGRNIPAEGASLSVAIANVDALRRRYLEVNRRGFAMSFTEPLAGLAGTVSGALLPTVGAGMLVHAMNLRINTFFGWLLLFLMGSVFWGILLVLAGALGLPVAAIGMVAMPLIDAFALGGLLRQGDGMLRELARLAEPLRDFFSLLSGPRENIRNPIWRAAMRLLDRAAVLVPHVLMLVAGLVLWLGPILRQLAVELPLLGAMAGETFALVRFIAEDLVAQLRALFDRQQGPIAVLLSVLDTLRSMLRTLRTGLTGMWRLVRDAVTGTGRRMGEEASRWWTTARPQIERFFLNHPFIRLLRALKEMVPAIRGVFAAVPPSSSSGPPGFFSRQITALRGEITGAITTARGPFPSLPTLPTLPSLEDLEFDAGGPVGGWGSILDLYRFAQEQEAASPGFLYNPFQLPPAAARARRRAGQPLSFFAAERQRLARELGQPLETALEGARAEQLAWRSLVLNLVDQLLPASIAAQVRQLEPLLEQIDAFLFPSEREAATLPVRALPDARLRPVVRRLRLRVAGLSESEARPWLDALATDLRADSYLVGSPP